MTVAILLLILAQPVPIPLETPRDATSWGDYVSAYKSMREGDAPLLVAFHDGTPPKGKFDFVLDMRQQKGQAFRDQWGYKKGVLTGRAVWLDGAVYPNTDWPTRARMRANGIRHVGTERGYSVFTHLKKSRDKRHGFADHLINGLTAEQAHIIHDLDHAGWRQLALVLLQQAYARRQSNKTAQVMLRDCLT